MPKLAPHGNQVPEDGREIWLLTGTRAWERAIFRMHHKLPVLVLAPGDDPASYRWPVRGREVLIVDRDSDDDLLEHLAHVLLATGATIVRIVCKSALGLVVYRRDTNGPA